MRITRAIVQTAFLLYLTIAATVGWIGYEAAKIFAPNNHKTEIQQNDAQAQAAAAAAVKAKAAQDQLIADSAAALAKQQAVAQDAAGFLAGAIMAQDAEANPRVGEKVAAKLTADAAAILPPATQQQIAAFQAIVAEMKAHDAQLTAELAVKEQEAAQAKQAAAAAQDQAKQSAAAAQAALADAGTKTATLAKTAASLNNKTAENVTLWQKLKAIGAGSTLVLIILPLIALAFPGTVPAIKVICTPLMKLWHLVHAREIALVAELKAKAEAEAATVKTQLASEVAAHADTKEILIKMATTP